MSAGLSEAAAARGRVVGNVDAGQLALHRREHVRIRGTHGLVHVHHGYGTRQVGPALGGIAGDDQLFHDVVVLLQDYAEARSGSDGSRLITYIGYLELGSLGCLKAEVSVKIGHCGVLSAFLGNRGSDDGLARLVFHSTADVDLLGRRNGTKSDEYCIQQYTFDVTHHNRLFLRLVKNALFTAKIFYLIK